MKRSGWFVAVVLAVLALLSMFAPAPVTRTVQADQRNACKGLQTAYDACRAGNPDPYACQPLREQLQAHACYYYGSGSGSGSF